MCNIGFCVYKHMWGVVIGNQLQHMKEKDKLVTIDKHQL